MTEEEKDKIELRSEEVQEIMGDVPPWILQWGITTIAIVLFAIFIGSFFFRYPDTLTAPVVVTTATPPVEIYAKAGGKIEELNTANQKDIHEGDIIAVIESTANYQDVKSIIQLLKEWKQKKINTSSLYHQLQIKDWKLGEIESSFTSFFNALHDYIILHKDEYYPQKLLLMEGQTKIQKFMQKEMIMEINLHRKQFNIAKHIYQRDSILFTQKAKTEAEFDNSKKDYLQNQQANISDRNTYKQEQLQWLQDKDNSLDLKHQYKDSKDKTLMALKNASEQLIAAIDNWCKQYIILSPINGVTNVMGNLNKNQTVAAGDLLLIILPKTTSASIGEAKLPAAGAGKVKKGQIVKVRLNNYPDNEFGYVQGTVKEISAIPDKDGNYYLEITFPSGLWTNYGKRLPQSRQMIGTAEIIIKNKRLAENLIEPIQRIIKNH